ncbi:MAG: P-loop NTPase [Bacteroidota bacterium]
MKIAIASGKGGTGKTLVSTALFHSLMTNGRKVILADCDAEEPNACVFFETREEEKREVTQKVPVIATENCTFCGRCHEVCNYNAIFYLPPAGIIQVIEDLCHGCGACSWACKEGAISEKEVVLGKVSSFSTNNGYTLLEGRMKTGVFSPVATIKETVRKAALQDLEIILLDAPPGTSCPFIQTVAQAGYVILVAEPTPFGLSDLRQSVNTLKTMNIPFGVIINKAGLGDDRIKDYLKTEDIELLMEIPFSRKIAENYAGGKLLTETEPKWQPEFVNMFEHINLRYGNRHNQR